LFEHKGLLTVTCSNRVNVLKKSQLLSEKCLFISDRCRI